MIDEVDGAGLKRALQNGSHRVVVDFWSPWCGPCRALRPHLDKIAAQRAPEWRFVAVNTLEHPDVAEAFGVSALPTVAFFEGERELSRLAGAALPSSVIEQLDEHCP